MCGNPLHALSIGLNVAGGLAAHSRQAEHAADAETIRRQNQLDAEIYRRRVEQYNNETYAQDISYANELLDYQRGEFDRQREMVGEATESIQQDYIRQLGTMLLRGVQESVAAQLFGEDTVRAGRRQTATGRAIAANRGVTGNTVDALLGNVDRQVGEGLTSIERNRVVLQRQLQLEALGLKARADTAISQIPIQTFQPITPPRAPAPTSPVHPSAPVPQPSRWGAIADAVGTVTQGYQNHYQWQGQRLPSSFWDTLRLRPGPTI